MDLSAERRVYVGQSYEIVDGCLVISDDDDKLVVAFQASVWKAIEGGEDVTD